MKEPIYLLVVGCVVTLAIPVMYMPVKKQPRGGNVLMVLAVIGLIQAMIRIGCPELPAGYREYCFWYCAIVLGMMIVQKVIVLCLPVAKKVECVQGCYSEQYMDVTGNHEVWKRCACGNEVDVRLNSVCDKCGHNLE